MSDSPDAPQLPSLTLLLGGVRSGKSARAVALTKMSLQAGRVLFVATAQAGDDEMATRIKSHRRERPTEWNTLETSLDVAPDLARALAAADEPYAAIIIDCVTFWVSNMLLSLGEDDDAEAIIAEHVGQLLKVWTSARQAGPRGTAGASRATRWIIVSNEVGLGVVPPTPLGRRYRDALGRANQLLAAAADDVILMVAGLDLPVKRGRA